MSLDGIAEFIVDRMSGYIAGGIEPENAAHYTSGELSAIYKGDHHTRDNTGQWIRTPLPENIDLETALKKTNAAIMEILKCYAETKAPDSIPKTTPEPRNIHRNSDAIRRTLAAGIGIKPFFAKSGDNDPDAYSADLQKIGALWNEGQRRFKAFIRGRFLALDIDRKPGKVDGLETFYRLFPRETLPAELQELPGSFPCYTQTPSGGFHLYFRYEGPEVKLRELAPGVEIKEWQITAPGSRRENGEYVLHGELNNAPPLYGLILDAIEETKRKKEQAKTERSKIAADRPVRFTKPRITLDDLADEAAAAYSGHHDRQVSFSGRACRCKFSGADTLAYVKSRTDIFGNDADTESTILSVFRDNGA
jgi:hypothetical protein